MHNSDNLILIFKMTFLGSIFLDNRNHVNRAIIEILPNCLIFTITDILNVKSLCKLFILSN